MTHDSLGYAKSEQDTDVQDVRPPGNRDRSAGTEGRRLRGCQGYGWNWRMANSSRES